MYIRFCTLKLDAHINTLNFNVMQIIIILATEWKWSESIHCLIIMLSKVIVSVIDVICIVLNAMIIWWWIRSMSKYKFWRRQSWLISKYYLRICQKRLIKTTINLTESHVIGCSVIYWHIFKCIILTALDSKIIMMISWIICGGKCSLPTIRTYSSI
jgi:hypothetical protein